ncbi:hypothetical protein [Listeria sp. ILCC792]|uniref:hypothetical protein n=1 Tax=Listeria sp. ILCC792 TaxID=1918331 RepID=UPI000B58F3FD|nr:hypothetical protein [Listeria sp. ILCC792]
METKIRHKTQKVELVGFRLSTPKFYKIEGEESVDIRRYDHEVISKYFEILLNYGEVEIKQKIDNRSITLLEYSENDISSYGFGKLLVFKSGKTQQIINEDDLSGGSKKKMNQGLKNEIYFIINKTTGVILIERDYDKIFNSKLLNSLLYHNKKLMYDYIDQFNEVNYNKETKDSIEMHKTKIVYINPLPSQDLFDELDEFARIKRFKIIKRVEPRKKNRGIESCEIEIEDLLNIAAGGTSLGQNVVSVEYHMDERGRGLEIENIKEMVKTIYQSHEIKDFVITGSSIGRGTKILTKDNITKKFEFDMDVDIEGEYVNIGMFFNNLVDLIQEYIEEYYETDIFEQDKVSELVVNP